MWKIKKKKVSFDVIIINIISYNIALLKFVCLYFMQ